VERTFGITHIKNMGAMDEWLHFRQDLSAREEENSEFLRLRLQDFANFWNEEDIKVFFIMPIIQIVDFYAPNKYRTFMEVTFQATATDIQNNTTTLRGRVEMLVATGKQRPQIPFFFLNEYKPQIKGQSDPQGQLLIAMLAAQAKNNGSNLPIYGLYNIGQFWFFVFLKDQEYTVSNAFDATDKDDLKRIINMLQYVKAHIERNV
jgi:hypothetical protein